MSSLWAARRTVGSYGEVAQGFVELEAFLRETSGLYFQPRTVTTATTLQVTDRLLLCNTTSGALTVTLYAAKQYPPQPYYIKLLAGANNVTLDADGTELIYTTAGAGTVVWNTAGTTKIIWPFETATKGTWAWVELNT